MSHNPNAHPLASHPDFDSSGGSATSAGLTHPPEVEKPLEATLNHLVESSDKPITGGEQTKGDAAGNYVIQRSTGEKIFEAMPLYVRVGMHLLFCAGKSFDTFPSVEEMLRAQSVKQGKIYDEEGSDVLPHIQSFVKTYDLPLDELLVPDLTQYPTFNSFFSRRLKGDARPIDRQSDPSVIVSPADCRMTAFENIDSAKKLWIKGKKFTIPELLGNDERFSAIQSDESAMIVIARLAPQDYHRFHSPVDAVVKEIKDISAVNPQAINEDLNVFTMNKRSVMLLEANLGPGKEKTPVAFVAVGAMLVGSIGWSKKPGDSVKKGQELGWFQYGGSTCITVFPSSAKSGIVFDEDLVSHSKQSIETAVRVGNHIAVAK